MGFGSGGFVAAGDGPGSSRSTDRVGEGNGKFAGFLVLEFSFTLSLGVAPPISFGLALASGETVVLTLVDWLVVPPAGTPASDAPVAGFIGSTGLLFGSAARAPGVVALLGCEFRVNA